jgi:hypothetical protein
LPFCFSLRSVCLDVNYLVYLFATRALGKE